MRRTGPPTRGGVFWVTPADSLVFYSTFGLGGPYLLNLDKGTQNKLLSGAWFGIMAGGFGRKLGTEVKVLMARARFLFSPKNHPLMA